MFLEGTKLALNQRSGMILAGLGILLSVFWVNHCFFCEKLANERFHQKRTICSFAQFWWATWANISWLLIFGERPKQIYHGCSFLVSDSLTVALLSWATWATRSLTSLFKKEGMSESLVFKKTYKKLIKT